MAKNFLKLNIQSELEHKKKKKTMLWVFCGHAIVLSVMFFTFSLKGCSSKPKERVIQVSLSAPQEQFMQQVSQPVQQPVQKMQQPKPKAQPQPKKVTKAVKKVPAVKPKPKWKALDPSQILKTRKTVTKQKPAPVVTPTYTSVNASDIANNLRKGMKSIKFSNSISANSSLLNYYDEVSSYLYSRWQQPSRSVLGGKLPIVNVKISVDSNGNVRNYTITDYSGISAMDESVKALLKGLSNFPKPPDGAMTIEVSLELENQMYTA